MIISDEQREENFQEYLRLLKDPNYVDVCFDEQSGGVSAVHREHKFDPKIGILGIRKGEYEKHAVEVLRKKGHQVYLESEVAPDGIKIPDGSLDGAILEIKSVEGKGKWAIKDKLHYATKQGADCVALYFPKKELFTCEKILDGWDKYLRDESSQKYAKGIRRIICIVEDTEIEFEP